MWQSSAGSFAADSQPLAWCTNFINAAIAEVVSHNGQHSMRVFRQRHAGEGVEKDFVAMMLDAEGAQVLMIGAMDGLSLQDAACCIALRTNGHLRHHDVRVGFGGEVA